MTTNHPEHGPVSLDRLHQISEILSKAAAQSDGGNLGYAMADAVKVIDGAIAAFRMEPYGYVHKGIYESCGTAGLSNDHGAYCNSNTHIALYTTPPATVVPEPKSYMDFCEQYPDMTLQESIERSAGCNACLAAMLHGDEPATAANKLPFEQWLSQQTGTIDVDCGCVTTEAFYHWLRVAYEAGNSPVIQDGWIPVSDRMPPNKPGSYEYIVFESLNNRAHHDYWNVPDGSCDDFSPFWNHYGKYVTHWMPLPAAPQQEDL